MGLIRNLTMFTLTAGTWMAVAPSVTQMNLDMIVERKLAAYDEAVKQKALEEAYKATHSKGGGH